jgi:hypothetical protein
MAEILHHGRLACRTRNNQDLKMIYSDFGTYLDECLMLGVQQPTSMTLEMYPVLLLNILYQINK